MDLPGFRMIHRPHIKATRRASGVKSQATTAAMSNTAK